MSLIAGTRLGPYEIQSSLGAGGMGEVYRALDTRLDRTVAIKVLPEHLALDPAALARFEREAKAVAALSHPNILGIFDFGTEGGTAYAAMELLEGETLRERMAASPMPPRKTIEYALQMAHGLAAAHEKGVVHRDLKPDNVFVTRDGRVKILDFGLAKLTSGEPDARAYTMMATQAAGTAPGTVLGTVGYMSPEQVRGLATDHRTDIFSFGAILYEMLSGRRAFKGESGVETMNAILKEEPPELAEVNRNLPPALERIVRRCLEKSPDERFYSAHDLGLALEALSGASTHSGPTVALSVRPRRRYLLPLLLAGALALVAGVAFVGGRQSAAPVGSDPLSLHRVTFRRGSIREARLAPDGHTIVYGAAWEPSREIQLYSTRPESPESLKLVLPDADILAISGTGEMAILVGIRPIRAYTRTGTLARVPISGGAPREIAENVGDADWGSDGTLAVARFVEGRFRLEYPMGKVLYETSGWISHLRIAPNGQTVAFLDHPILGDDRGSVALVDRAGKVRTLAQGWESEQGLEWSHSGAEIWFTAASHGLARGLHAVTPDGRLRLVYRAPGSLMLQDISPDGRILLEHNNGRRGIGGLLAGDAKERDLSWLDWSQPGDLSPDGKTLVMTEEGEGGGAGYSVYLRKAADAAAVRLGEGEAMALSPDGKWVLTQSLRSSPSQFVLLPTGPGEPRPVTNDNIDHVAGRFLPDGQHVLFIGIEPGRRARVYLQAIAGGTPRPVTPEAVTGLAISPDGRFVVCRGPDRMYAIYPMAGGDPRPIAGVNAADNVLRWSTDGKSLFVRAPSTEGPVTFRIERVDLATGRRTPWLNIAPSLPGNPGGIILAADGKSYVYGYGLTMSDLYLAQGLR